MQSASVAARRVARGVPPGRAPSARDDGIGCGWQDDASVAPDAPGTAGSRFDRNAWVMGRRIRSAHPSVRFAAAMRASFDSIVIAPEPARGKRGCAA